MRPPPSPFSPLPPPSPDGIPGAVVSVACVTAHPFPPCSGRSISHGMLRSVQPAPGGGGVVGNSPTIGHPKIKTKSGSKEFAIAPWVKSGVVEPCCFCLCFCIVSPPTHLVFQRPPPHRQHSGTIVTRALPLTKRPLTKIQIFAVAESSEPESLPRGGGGGGGGSAEEEPHRQWCPWGRTHWERTGCTCDGFPHRCYTSLSPSPSLTWLAVHPFLPRCPNQSLSPSGRSPPGVLRTEPPGRRSPLPRRCHGAAWTPATTTTSAVCVRALGGFRVAIAPPSRGFHRLLPAA